MLLAFLCCAINIVKAEEYTFNTPIVGFDRKGESEFAVITEEGGLLYIADHLGSQVIHEESSPKMAVRDVVLLDDYIATIARHKVTYTTKKVTLVGEIDYKEGTYVIDTKTEVSAIANGNTLYVATGTDLYSFDLEQGSKTHLAQYSRKLNVRLSQSNNGDLVLVDLASGWIRRQSTTDDQFIEDSVDRELHSFALDAENSLILVSDNQVLTLDDSLSEVRSVNIPLGDYTAGIQIDTEYIAYLMDKVSGNILTLDLSAATGQENTKVLDTGLTGIRSMALSHRYFDDTDNAFKFGWLVLNESGSTFRINIPLDGSSISVEEVANSIKHYLKPPVSIGLDRIAAMGIYSVDILESNYQTQAMLWGNTTEEASGIFSSFPVLTATHLSRASLTDFIAFNAKCGWKRDGLLFTCSNPVGYRIHEIDLGMLFPAVTITEFNWSLGQYVFSGMTDSNQLILIALNGEVHSYDLIFTNQALNSLNQIHSLVESDSVLLGKDSNQNLIQIELTSNTAIVSPLRQFEQIDLDFYEVGYRYFLSKPQTLSDTIYIYRVGEKAEFIHGITSHLLEADHIMAMVTKPRFIRLAIFKNGEITISEIRKELETSINWSLTNSEKRPENFDQISKPWVFNGRDVYRITESKVHKFATLNHLCLDGVAGNRDGFACGFTENEISNVQYFELSDDLDKDGYQGISDRFKNSYSQSSDLDFDGVSNLRDPDDDNDGISDTLEVLAGASPLNRDSDSDSVVDAIEYSDYLAINNGEISVSGDIAPPYIAQDSDFDKILDPDDLFKYNEREWADNDLDGIGNNADLDDDNDGLSDIDELAYGSSVFNEDSDGDGISDGDEVHAYGSNPILLDSDGDGLADNEEIALGLDPAISNIGLDSDHDGVSDLEELALGTNPLVVDGDHVIKWLIPVLLNTM